MTRGKFPGWSLDPDPLYVAPPSDNEEQKPRAGCWIFPFLVIVLLVAAASIVPTPEVSFTAPAAWIAQTVEHRPHAPESAGSEVAGSSPAPWAGAPPSGAIGTVLLAGWAAFCDPTPKRCQSWGDGALVGAMPSFSFGDEPFLARVCALAGECVVVTVVSFCACGDRHGDPTVIDLSPEAMRRIEPDYRRLGIVQVTVEFPVDGLPETDTR